MIKPTSTQHFKIPGSNAPAQPDIVVADEQPTPATTTGHLPVLVHERHTEKSEPLPYNLQNKISLIRTLRKALCGHPRVWQSTGDGDPLEEAECHPV